MRQDSRHKTPAGAGDLNSQTNRNPIEEPTAESVGPPTILSPEGLGDDLEQAEGSASFRFRGRFPSLESGLAARRDLAPPESPGGAYPADEDIELPHLAAGAEAELATEIALDLQRLREASDQIAAASDWIDQHSMETPAQNGEERVESSRGRRAPTPATSPATVRPHDAARGDYTVEMRNAAPEAEHQERVPMKITTSKRTVADVSQNNSAEDSSTPTPAAAATPPQTAADLEAELREAREALQRLRERAALQTRMYGSVGAQTRKLDQRAGELRARVAKAQEALNERARRLQASLERERERLRAYHAKLQQRARELSEWTQERKAKLGDEIAAQRTAIEVERAALARREAELERRFAAFAETDRRDIEAVRAELEQSYMARLAEVEQQRDARLVELEAREEALLRREAEQSARLKAFEEARTAAEANLRAEAASLEEATRTEQERRAAETIAIRKELEENAGQRTAELTRLQELLSAREAAVAKAEHKLNKLKQALDAKSHSMTDRAADLDRRDEESARMSAAMEVRERRLQEWQSRIEQTDTRLEAVRSELENEVQSAQKIADENQNQSADLKTQFEDLAARRAELVLTQEQAESRLKVLREKEESVDNRSAEVDRLKAEYDEQTRLITEERRQFTELTERSEEIERQRGELATRIAEIVRREEGLKERLAAHEAEVEAVERTRKDLDAVRESFAAREREIQAREAEAAERNKRAEDFEFRLQQKAEDLAGERSAFEELRAQHEEGVASLEKAREKIARQQLLLDEAQLALQIDRQHLNEQEQSLTQGRATLQRERDQLAVAQAAATSIRTELERHAAELARLQEETVAAKTAMEVDRARLERDGVALRDRQRVLAEEQAGLETARQEADALRRDLTKRIEDADEFRRQLLEKASHLKARKEQLAHDATAVDERLRTLHAELAKVADQDRKLQREREQLEAERSRMKADREGLEKEKEDLEQARRTFQAGLRSLDESRQQVAERETVVAARSAELDELRRCVDVERAEVQRQRQELLSLQAERSDAAGQIEALMAQAETQQAELRRREEFLRAHEQALAARATELSRAEDELNRRRREHESLDRDLSAESEALASERKDFESVMEAERVSLEKARQEVESELAAERSRLQERARELDTAMAAHRAASAHEEMMVEKADADRIRKEIEAEYADRLAEVAREEEAVELRFRSRLEEMDRDIAHRLAALEKEIRERREQAAREVADRQRLQEEELRLARSRLDEQVEELRRRQTAAAQEHALLQEQRRELAEQRKELHNLRRQFESEGRLLRDELPADADAGLSDRWGPFMAATDDDTAADSASVSPARPAEVVSSLTDSEDLLDLAEEDYEPVPADEAKRHDPGAVLSTPADDTETLAAAHMRPTKVPYEQGVEAAPKARRRIRTLRGVLSALVVGVAVAGAYLLSLPRETIVQGRVVLNKTGSAAPLTATEHFNRLRDSAVMSNAAEKTGIDVPAMYREGKLTVVLAPAGDAVELTARVPRAQAEQVQACLDGWAAAYQDVLNESVISGSERKNRLAEMEADQKKLAGDRKAAAAALEQLKTSLQSDPRFGRAESARIAKGELKVKVVQAREELEAAKTALAQFEAAPAPTDPILPTEEQLAQACAADAEVMQAIEQRDAKAREFHRVLTEAMSQSQTPLATLLASIIELASEVDQQLADQSDKDIRRELEQIAVDLKDYRRFAETFSRNWDELAPKVAAWKAGGDAELLLEYQKKAEVLIREFHSQSGESSKAVGAKADAIAQEGSEMTMRRVIHGRLRKALLACLQARNDWILAARGAVPRYNLELKALDDVIRDLAPRIEQHRNHHREKLTEHLMKVRTDERAATLQRLRGKVEDASRQYERLTDEFVKLDTDATDDETFKAEAQQKQNQIRDQETLLARLDKQLSDTQAEIKRLQSSDDVSLAGIVNYERLPSATPGRLEAPRRNKAIALGAAAALVFFVGFVALSGFRRPRSTPRV